MNVGKIRPKINHSTPVSNVLRDDVGPQVSDVSHNGAAFATMGTVDGDLLANLL